jgi:DNA-binding FadR family transcriptional regulator
MSSVASVSSSTNPYQTSQSNFAQFMQDFKAIGSALQSGNLSSAQSALAAFQKDLQGNSQSSTSSTTNQPFGKNSQANTDYQSLVTALQSGDTAGAQKAFTSLQSDLKTGHKGHHHHHGSSTTTDTVSPSTSSTDATTDSALTSLDATA